LTANVLCANVQAIVESQVLFSPANPECIMAVALFCFVDIVNVGFLPVWKLDKAEL
jgi:hypothetical protein